MENDNQIIFVGPEIVEDEGYVPGCEPSLTSSSAGTNVDKDRSTSADPKVTGGKVTKSKKKQERRPYDDLYKKMKMIRWRRQRSH